MRNLSSHPDIELFNQNFPYIVKLQNIATKHGIKDVLVDNGLKILQICLLLDLVVIPGRNGNDAIDGSGQEYEIKSSGGDHFSTGNHFSEKTLDRYRNARFIFATYDTIYLQEIYTIDNSFLEKEYFSLWERKLLKKKANKVLDDSIKVSLNDPRMSVDFIKNNGMLIYKEGMYWDAEYSSMLPRKPTFLFF